MLVSGIENALIPRKEHNSLTYVPNMQNKQMTIRNQGPAIINIFSLQKLNSQTSVSMNTRLFSDFNSALCIKLEKHYLTEITAIKDFVNFQFQHQTSA